MALFPEFPVTGIASDKQIPTRTYAVDWERGRIGGFVDKLDAVNQAIYKALQTPRFNCLAYDDQYGSELETLLTDKDVTRDYIEEEMPSMIEDCLLADGRIAAVDDMTLEYDADNLWVTFDVQTQFGDTRLSVEGVV